MPTPTILLLEDEALIALDVEMVLADLTGGSVTTRSSCTEALVWLADNTPDIAILDIFLRDGECIEVADLLLKRNVPFLIHSARSKGDDNTHRVFAKGVWITKPTSPENLAQAVNDYLLHDGADS